MTITQNLSLKQPSYLTGPKQLRAVLTFLPVEIKPKRKKKGTAAAEVTVDKVTAPKFALPIPLINSFYLIVNAAIRSRNMWAKRSVDEMIAEWRQRGCDNALAYFKANRMMAPHLEWAEVVIVCYWPDRIRRDAHNLWHKPVFDGLSDAYMWVDDSRILTTTIANGGCDRLNPRIEVYIYEVDLALKDQALLIDIKTPKVTPVVDFATAARKITAKKVGKV